MANSTAPKRLTWPFSKYQWELLDLMVEELYRRVFKLETAPVVTSSTNSGSSSSPSMSGIGYALFDHSVDVSDVDGLDGELASVLQAAKTAAAASSTATNVLETYISLRIL